MSGEFTCVPEKLIGSALAIAVAAAAIGGEVKHLEDKQRAVEEGRAVAGPIYDKGGLPLTPCFWNPNNPQKGKLKTNGSVEFMIDNRCTDELGGVRAYTYPDGDPMNQVWDANGLPVELETGTKVQLYCFDYGKLTGKKGHAVSDRWALGEIPVGDHQSVRAYIPVPAAGYPVSHGLPELPDLPPDVLRKCA
ncbi:MAG TPA: hypothetical protein VF733_01525 [Candidatus Saccharimonadales bacterium]